MSDRCGDRPRARKRDRSQKPTPHDVKWLERALARVGLGVPDPDAAEPEGKTMDACRIGPDQAGDEFDNLERMWRDIITGQSKDKTRTIRHAADSERWDRMAKGRDEIVADGMTPVMGLPMADDWPGSEPATPDDPTPGAASLLGR